MSGTPYTTEALERLRSVFCRNSGTELTETDVAELADLDDDECRILLGVLHETGAIEQRRRRVFICRQSSWWTSASQPG